MPIAASARSLRLAGIRRVAAAWRGIHARRPDKTLMLGAPVTVNALVAWRGDRSHLTCRPTWKSTSMSFFWQSDCAELEIRSTNGVLSTLGVDIAHINKADRLPEHTGLFPAIRRPVNANVGMCPSLFSPFLYQRTLRSDQCR